MRIKILALAGLLAASGIAPDDAPRFQSAKPVWPRGQEKEMNLLVGFRAIVDVPAGEKVTLRITASTFYRATWNGAFVAHGPARAPQGFFRVDEWDLSARAGKNLVAIEVAGYNINSYAYVDQPSFLMAEVVAGGRILAATGTDFEAAILPERLQKVQRYSYQRAFLEAYRLTPGSDPWKRDPAASFQTIPCETFPAPKLLPRRAPRPDFALLPAKTHVASGTVRTDAPVAKPWRNQSRQDGGRTIKGYRESELELDVVAEFDKVATTERRAPEAKLALGTGGFHIFDFGRNLTGFIKLRVSCTERARVALVFDELLVNDDVNWRRLGCVNAIPLDLAPGTYDFETLEPYTLEYLKVIALEGACTLETPAIREYAHPAVPEALLTGNADLESLFAAARETFRQNSVDFFMDCPSRERAGWLCDSFFTARAAMDFVGRADVEKAYLENFLLPERYADLPDGMFPMCFPADNPGKSFIPNWALWLVLQLEEYEARSGDRAMVDAFRPRILKLFEYFAPFQNEDGLLEKLKGWIFIEWSDAARFVKDVNYPTNMLYAAALASAGRMYGRKEFLDQAAKVRETIRRQSFDGTFFVDNAKRNDGKLEVTRNRSEICQYSAFFFDVATPQSHAELWKTVCSEFGPKKRHAEVHPAAAFIGNMLRMEVLSRYGRSRQLAEELTDYYLPMARRTGTLWESREPDSSCNHGFGGHIAHMLYRDVLGLYRVDPLKREVHLRFSDVDLPTLAGQVPTPQGPVALRWRREAGRLIYALTVPSGYAVQVKNLSGLELHLE